MFFHEIFLRRVPGKLVLFDMLLPNPTNQIMADHQLTWAKAVICFVVFEDFRLVKCDDLTRHTVDGKDATQPVHVKNLPFVIGFVYIEWCIGFLRFLPSTVCGCFSLARRPKWGKRDVSWNLMSLIRESSRYTGEHRFATDPTGCLYLGNWICNGKWWCYGTEVNLGKCCNLVSRVW